jgi:Coenzyme PQQ synthesis protein D (PqqD)
VADSTEGATVWVPRRAAGVNYEIIEGRAVVIDPNGKELVTLNEVGTMIWEHLDGERDVPVLVDELLPRFDGVTREQFDRDLRGYLDELRDVGILESATS